MGVRGLRRGPGTSPFLTRGAPRSSGCLGGAGVPARADAGVPILRGGSVPCSGGRGRRAPRSAVSRSRRVLARDAPRGATCLVPVRRSPRCAEARRLPAPWAGFPCRDKVLTRWGGVPCLRRGPVPCPGPRWGAWCAEARLVPCPGWGGGPDAPRSVGFPVPVGRGSRCPEGRRLPCPVETGSRCPEGRRLPDSAEAVHAGLRRAPFAVPRGPGFLADEAVDMAVPRWGAVPPKRSGSLSRVRGGVPRLRRGPVPCPGWGGGPGAPKRAGFPVPVRPCSRGSEELRWPCPGEVVRPVPRRAPLAVPRGTKLAVRRGAPSALSRWPGVLPRRAGDGCAKKKFRCDDAPIRRSGPPRHRALGRVGGRSSHPSLVKLPSRYRCRSADAAQQSSLHEEPARLSRSGRSPACHPRAADRVPGPKPRSLRLAAPAPAEAGRRPGPSKPHEAADFKALLR